MQMASTWELNKNTRLHYFATWPAEFALVEKSHWKIWFEKMKVWVKVKKRKGEGAVSSLRGGVKYGSENC